MMRSTVESKTSPRWLAGRVGCLGERTVEQVGQSGDITSNRPSRSWPMPIATRFAHPDERPRMVRWSG